MMDAEEAAALAADIEEEEAAEAAAEAAAAAEEMRDPPWEPGQEAAATTTTPKPKKKRVDKPGFTPGRKLEGPLPELELNTLKARLATINNKKLPKFAEVAEEHSEALSALYGEYIFFFVHINVIFSCILTHY